MKSWPEAERSKKNTAQIACLAVSNPADDYAQRRQQSCVRYKQRDRYCTAQQRETSSPHFAYRAAADKYLNSFFDPRAEHLQDCSPSRSFLAGCGVDVYNSSNAKGTEAADPTYASLSLSAAAPNVATGATDKITATASGVDLSSLQWSATCTKSSKMCGTIAGGLYTAPTLTSRILS